MHDDTDPIDLDAARRDRQQRAVCARARPLRDERATYARHAATGLAAARAALAYAQATAGRPTA